MEREEKGKQPRQYADDKTVHRQEPYVGLGHVVQGMFWHEVFSQPRSKRLLEVNKWKAKHTF